MDDVFCINGKYLDSDQINVVLCNNPYTLVIAGAGSGKTFTILGKIKYLIESLNYKEKEILCISLTNDTVNNLKNKINDLGYNIDVYTFHKLGLNIINKNNNYSITSDNYLSFIIDEYFLSYIITNKHKKRIFYAYLDCVYYENFLVNYKYKNLKEVIISAIHLIKNNNITSNALYNIYKKIIINRFIFKYILDIYLIYKRELESALLIDFDDMINLASNMVKEKNIILPYKYIIIDEYQDTSYSRYNLIKSILDNNKARLLAVGDDWQSIYRFTGCELELFFNFKNLFKDSTTLYMNNTYRNSQELIDIAGKFIMKNNKQIKKNLISSKRLTKPIKILFNDDKNVLTRLIDYINKDDILILGRNNYDIDKYNINNYRYLTIHKSKGLEAEEVILINLENKIDGFPNKKKDNCILNKIKNNKSNYLYDEERRLFYVALTRSKNSIYLIVNKRKMSIFVKELIKDYKEYILYLDI